VTGARERALTAPATAKVTVVGAGNYGATVAHLLTLGGYAAEVVLIDVIEGRPQGLALDLAHARPLSGSPTVVVGSNGYDEAAGSDVCVITAGAPRKPGMSRLDLLETNAAIVADVTRRLAAVAPGAVLVVVTNPLDEMTALAAEVSGFERVRVVGQAGVLDTARFRHLLAEAAGVAPGEVEAMTLGSHGDTMVPVPSRARIAGRPVAEVVSAEVLDEVVGRTAAAGAEIVGLLRTGSAFFAPAAAAERMVRAVVTGGDEVLPVSAWVDGPYGIHGVYLGVPARLGPRGVVEVVELDLAPGELAALRAAAEAVGSRQARVAALAG